MSFLSNWLRDLDNCNRNRLQDSKGIEEENNKRKDTITREEEHKTKKRS